MSHLLYIVGNITFEHNLRVDDWYTKRNWSSINGFHRLQYIILISPRELLIEEIYTDYQMVRTPVDGIVKHDWAGNFVNSNSRCWDITLSRSRYNDEHTSGKHTSFLSHSKRPDNNRLSRNAEWHIEITVVKEAVFVLGNLLQFLNSTCKFLNSICTHWQFKAGPPTDRNPDTR